MKQDGPSGSLPASGAEARPEADASATPARSSSRVGRRSDGPRSRQRTRDIGTLHAGRIPGTTTMVPGTCHARQPLMDGTPDHSPPADHATTAAHRTGVGCPPPPEQRGRRQARTRPGLRRREPGRRPRAHPAATPAVTARAGRGSGGNGTPHRPRPPGPVPPPGGPAHLVARHPPRRGPARPRCPAPPGSAPGRWSSRSRRPGAVRTAPGAVPTGPRGDGPAATPAPDPRTGSPAHTLPRSELTHRCGRMWITSCSPCSFHAKST